MDHLKSFQKYMNFFRVCMIIELVMMAIILVISLIMVPVAIAIVLENTYYSVWMMIADAALTVCNALMYLWVMICTVRYMNYERKVGTPFTTEGAKKARKVGIWSLWAFGLNVLQGLYSLWHTYAYPNYTIGTTDGITEGMQGVTSIGSALLWLMAAHLFAYGAQMIGEKKGKGKEEGSEE